MRDPISSANWTFTMHKVSAGVYRITGKHRVGATILQSANAVNELDYLVFQGKVRRVVGE